LPQQNQQVAGRRPPVTVEDPPWKDLTAATLAELRFDSIAGWLPQDETAALRAEFHRELDRLYTAVAAADAE
jgi:hypothetical protein